MNLRPRFVVFEKRLAFTSEVAQFYDVAQAEQLVATLDGDGRDDRHYFTVETFNNDVRLRRHYELVRAVPLDGMSSVIAQLLDREQAEMFAREPGSSNCFPAPATASLRSGLVE